MPHLLGPEATLCDLPSLGISPSSLKPLIPRIHSVQVMQVMLLPVHLWEGRWISAVKKAGVGGRQLNLCEPQFVFSQGNNTT